MDDLLRGLIDFGEEGSLTKEQLDLVLAAMPFDLDLIDENDIIRYHSPEPRVFRRQPGVQGMDVRLCHPMKSQAALGEMLAAFKSGEADRSEAWLDRGERFIHIVYYALRDAEGAYRGCLEVCYDAAHVRSLEGSRRDSVFYKD